MGRDRGQGQSIQSLQGCSLTTVTGVPESLVHYSKFQGSLSDWLSLDHMSSLKAGRGRIWSLQELPWCGADPWLYTPLRLHTWEEKSEVIWKVECILSSQRNATCSLQPCLQQNDTYSMMLVKIGGMREHWPEPVG